MPSPSIVGGKLVQANVLFSLCNKFFFSSSASDIVMYSVETGLPCKRLSGHKNDVTQVSLNPKNTLQLYSISVDGTLKLWDYSSEEPICLKTWEVSEHNPITHLAFPPTEDSSSSLLYLVIKRKKDVIRIATLNVDNNEIRTIKIKADKICAKKCLGLDTLTHGGKTWLAFSSRKETLVYCPATEEMHSLASESGEDFTVMTLHPMEFSLAVGTSTGKILLWYCFDRSKTSEVVTSLHWHAHTVTSIAFASDSYMLSGGHEGVLVLWQLDTKHKDYLPRLGAEITGISISPDNSMYALGFVDNTIRIVSATNLANVQTIMGLKFATLDHKAYPLNTGLVLDPRKGNVVLNGVPGTLQFYNAKTDKHVLELEVAPRNKISKRMDVETIHSNVALAAFSSDGNWMATVDERDDGQFQPEVFLKFWNWDQGSWCVNTRVDMPHKGRVKSMAMVGSGKTGAMAVTCGTDNKFKIWELVNSDDGEHAWSCRSIGGYKNLPASCVAFSPDGSIMAISYGQVVTLWDPSTSTLVRVLTYPADGVVRVEFSGKGAFLYARSPSRIYTWNLLTCALVIVRNIKKEVLSISADPASSNLLVATHACVMVYGPTDAEPLRIFSAEGDGMSGAEIIDAVHGEGVVYFLDKKYQITTFSLAEEKVIETAKTATKKQSRSLISDIYPESEDVEESDRNTDQVVVSPPGVISSFFDEVPSNVLPQPSLLITPFLDSIMMKRKVVDEGIVDEVKTGDEDTLVEEEMAEDVVVPKIDRAFLASLFV